MFNSPIDVDAVYDLLVSSGIRPELKGKRHYCLCLIKCQIVNEIKA